MLKPAGFMVERNLSLAVGSALMFAAVTFSATFALAQDVSVRQGFTATTYATDVFQPVGVGLDSAGNLYAGTGGFTTWVRSYVVKITPDGQVSPFGDIIRDPDPIAVDAFDNVYVGARTGGIYRIAPDGTTTVFAPTQNVVFNGQTYSAVWNVDGLCMDTAGNLISADNNATICRIDPAGKVEILAITPSRPGGVSVAPSGDIYVALGRENRIMIIPAAGGPPVFLAAEIPGPTYLAFEPFLGTLYVSSTGAQATPDAADGVIYEVAADGSFTTFATGLVDGSGMIFDGKGNLFVADTGAGRIHKISGFPKSRRVFDETFTRSTGKPVTVTRTVDSPFAGYAVLRVENGDAAGNHRESSVTVSVNGVLIVTPTSLNKQTAAFETALWLPQGRSTIEVQLRATPGALIRAIIEFR